MDYRKTAQEILDKVGGSKNIVSAAHCATRLRLVIADNSKADKTAIENVDGVKGVFEASGQLQIILGTGTVNKVFDEFISIAGITASSKGRGERGGRSETERIYEGDQAAWRYFCSHHPGHRGQRFPHGYHELAGLHDQQWIP